MLCRASQPPRHHDHRPHHSRHRLLARHAPRHRPRSRHRRFHHRQPRTLHPQSRAHRHPLGLRPHHHHRRSRRGDHHVRPGHPRPRRPYHGVFRRPDAHPARRFESHRRDEVAHPEIFARPSTSHRRARPPSRTQLQTPPPLAFPRTGRRTPRRKPRHPCSHPRTVRPSRRLPHLTPALCRTRPRTRRLRCRSAAGPQHYSRPQVGHPLSVGFWSGNYRRHDAHHRRHRPALLFRGLQIRLAQSRPDHRFRPSEPGLRPVHLLPHRLGRRPLLRPSQLDTQLIISRR